jgi:exosortase K
VKTKLCVLAVAALFAWGLKRHYADAHTDTLSWILMPTAHLVGLVTGTAFTAVSGEGYLSAERLFLIAKACAGINFMIAAFAMVAFALLHRAQSPGTGAAVVGVSLLVSYAAAVAVNAVRIVIAMWLAGHSVAFGSVTAADLHRLEGITVYFGGLWLLYELVQRVDRGTTLHRVAWPLACYYFITLVVPIVNGALGSGQAADAFLDHALVVIVSPLVLILCVSGARRLFSAYPRRSVSAGSSPHARRAGSHAAATATATIAAAPNT